ncbi:MAG: hypothetical protein QOE87_1512 [Gaiellales bacterium]|jgi:hypothetical protein|nr:hypothetical protein [Gaiellales bacterium]
MVRREAAWTRVELVGMDPQCADISVALYRRTGENAPSGVVHTYSEKPGAAERVAYIAGAMRVLGGLDGDEGDTVVRFPCGEWHASAAKRIFLEAVKTDQSKPLEARPLVIVDRKTGQTITAEKLAPGAYRLLAEGGEEGAASRAVTAGRGMRKLAELPSSDEDTAFAFACGCDHDSLVGMLLPRAVNVRDTLREEELIAARGLLAAPGTGE